MTDTRLTQAAVEEWIAPLALGQVTQVVLEMWSSVGSTTVQTLVTQISIETWASVAVAGGGQGPRVMVLA